MADQSESRPGGGSFIGLYTTDNPLFGPQGVMNEADNVVSRNRGEYSPRRGFGRYGTSLISTKPVRRMFEYDGNLHLITQAGPDCEMWYETQVNSTYDWDANGRINEILPTTSAFNKVNGSFSVLSDRTGNNFRRPQPTELNDIMYVNTDDSQLIKYPAGAPTIFEQTKNEQVPWLDLEIIGDGDPSQTNWFFSSNTTVQTVAYRVVTKKVIGNTEFVSAPSPRYWLISELLPDGTFNSFSGSTLELSFSDNHGLSVGDYIEINSSTNISFQFGIYQINAVPSSTTAEVTYNGTDPTGATFDWSKSRQVSITFSEPKSDPSVSYQIYRTNVTAVINNIGATDPGDEMFLVTEQAQTSGSASGTDWSYDTTFSEYSWIDSNSSLELGQTLYTSPSQGGIQLANEIAPSAFTQTQFQETLFMANTKSDAAGFINLAAPGVLSVGDSITINDGVTDYTYIVATSENVSAREFELDTDSRENTARSLARIINSDRNNNVIASYVSTFEGKPGDIKLRNSDDLTTNGSTTIVEGAFIPNLAQDETNFKVERKKNRIRYSKLQQYTNFPSLNFLDVDEEAEILHLQPTNTRLYVFTDRGVFELSGLEPPWSVRLIDPTVQLVAPDSVITLEGFIYGVSTQGVFRMSGSGKEIISRPIEDNIFDRMKFQNFFYTVHATKDEIEHEYILWLPESKETDTPTEAFRYNTQINSWTKIIRDFTSSYMRPGDQAIYTGLPVKNGQTQVMKLRRSDSVIDQQDEFLDIQVNSFSGTTANVTFFDPWIGPTVGDAIELNDELRWIENVIALTGGNWELTLDNTPLLWTVGTGKLSKSIKSKVRFKPFTMGAVPMDKRWTEVNVMLRKANTSRVVLGYETEKNTDLKSNIFNTIENTLFATTSGSKWASNTWGANAWSGTEPFSYYSFRDLVPKERAVSQILWVTLEHNRAKEGYTMVDLTVWGSTTTYKTTR